MTILSNLDSKVVDSGLINKSIKIPIEKIANPTGIKTSKIDFPTFLIDINSLLLIKFLNKKAIAITIINGIVSFIIDGIFIILR